MASKAVKILNKGYHHRYPSRVNGNHGGGQKTTSKNARKK